MDFRVLGALEVLDRHADLTPSAPKLRTVLSLMVVRHGQVVRTGSLIDELWGEAPPSSALTTLQTYIYQLRKSLPDPHQGGDEPKPRGRQRSMRYAERHGWLETKPCGYIALIPPENIDLWRFERLAAEGRTLLEQGDPARAAASFRNALALWRGPLAADVPRGQNLDAYAARIEEIRFRMLEQRIDAELQMGWHRELVGELKELVADHPLQEGLHARLLLALYRSDRRFEALEAFHSLRQILINELGLEPSPSVKRLHEAILTSDATLDHSPPVPAAIELTGAPQVDARPPHLETAPGLALPEPANDPPATWVPASPLTQPAQLPPDIGDFTGRETELPRIVEHLIGGDDSSAPRIVCISGMAGVGKTALAIHAAHRARFRFSYGQLYAQLSGTQVGSTDPASALDGFLRALPGHPETFPDDVEEREKLYRTLTADRSLLVVLDDAESAAQVQHLLPASRRSAVIITSRTPLPHLPGASHIDLKPLSVDDGVTLLCQMLKTDRVSSERSDAERIVARCGGLPLAIRAVGARLSSAQHWLLADLQRRLEDEHGRLTELRYDDLDVVAGFARSYRKLSTPIRRAFTSLGSSGLTEFTTSQAAGLLGTDRRTASGILSELVASSLLEARRREDNGEMWYGFHALTYLFARLCADELDIEVDVVPS